VKRWEIKIRLYGAEAKDLRGSPLTPLIKGGTRARESFIG
jgi:hypothetical protein